MNLSYKIPIIGELETPVQISVEKTPAQWEKQWAKFPTHFLAHIKADERNMK